MQTKNPLTLLFNTRQAAILGHFTASIAFVSLSALPLGAQPAEAPIEAPVEILCVVPGNTMHWELDHCLLLTDTDDAHNRLVRACMDLVQRSPIPEDCKRNLKLKRYRCLELKQRGNFYGSLEDCIEATNTVGPTVRAAEKDANAAP